MALGILRVHKKDFNPRPREEGDLLPEKVEDKNMSISIHALVKRATRSDEPPQKLQEFQSTPS